MSDRNSTTSPTVSAPFTMPRTHTTRPGKRGRAGAGQRSVIAASGRTKAAFTQRFAAEGGLPLISSLQPCQPPYRSPIASPTNTRIDWAMLSRQMAAFCGREVGGGEGTGSARARGTGGAWLAASAGAASRTHLPRPSSTSRRGAFATSGLPAGTPAPGRHQWRQSRCTAQTARLQTVLGQQKERGRRKRRAVGGQHARHGTPVYLQACHAACCGAGWGQASGR